MLDENLPISSEKIPLRWTWIKSDFKFMTDALIKQLDPTPDALSAKWASQANPLQASNLP